MREERLKPSLGSAGESKAARLLDSPLQKLIDEFIDPRGIAVKRVVMAFVIRPDLLLGTGRGARGLRPSEGVVHKNITMPRQTQPVDLTGKEAFCADTPVRHFGGRRIEINAAHGLPSRTDDLRRRVVFNVARGLID